MQRYVNEILYGGVNMFKYSGIKAIAVLIVIGFVFGVIIVSIMSFKKLEIETKKDDLKTEKTNDNDINEVKKYLEEKYSKEFIIDPDYVSNAGSFIPGNVGNPTVYYKAYSKEDLSYGFRVYKFQNSKENTKVPNLNDGYCWKFFREQIKNIFEEQIKSLRIDNYKLVIDINPRTTFNNNIKPESPIELYFNNSNRKVSLNFYLILNSDDNINEVKDKLYNIISEFYEKYDKNMYIYLVCFKTMSDKDFNSINQIKRENSVFVESKELFEKKNNPWGVNLETLFTIEDFEFNGVEENR